MPTSRSGLPEKLRRRLVAGPRTLCTGIHWATYFEELSERCMVFDIIKTSSQSHVNLKGFGLQPSSDPVVEIWQASD